MWNMPVSRRDRELGLDRSITRRDFLNGVGVAVTGSLLSPPSLEAFGILPEEFAPEKEPGYYPPALTGLRGSHDGSWEVAHQMKEGKTWDQVGPEADTGELYDLIVVGGGISGLAAAYFFRKQAGLGARILILDNHDDFGGHAKRNELQSAKRLLIGYGGSQSIDTPSGLSSEAKGLLRELGIDLSRFYEAFDQDLYASLNLGEGVFFDKETFGADRLVARGKLSWQEFAALAPLSEKARKDLVRLHEAKADYLLGLTPEEKKARLKEISYRDFLKDDAKVDASVLAYFQTRPHGLFGIGIDGVPALNCWRLGYPGFQGVALERGGSGRVGQSPKPNAKSEPYIFHFPDGNASIARLLVRALIPMAAPGSTMEDMVTARFDYSRLDEESSPVRVRLNSTVVRVRHRGDPASAKDMEVIYVRGGKPQRVRGRYGILACWNGVIPYLCPDLPEAQRKGLSYAVKVPLVSTNVLIRNWKSFHQLGISRVSCPGSYYSSVALDFPVSLGDYHHPRSPEEPMVLGVLRVPTSPGLPPREQFRTGRYELLETAFETFERNIRDQLGRMLGEGGFDPARDIEAITVNRWPHGYAYEYQYHGEPDWTEENKPCIVGRQPFGRLSIANSDAAGEAYADAAIDQAYRAVQEILDREA